MPKRTKLNERARAQSLVKTCIKNKMDQTAVAKELGVSRQAVQQRLKQKPVQDCLQKFLDSNKLKKKLIEVAKDGLEASRVISANIINIKSDDPTVEEQQAHSKTQDFIEVPDHNARHKFFRDIMIINGHLKSNGNGKGVSVVNIIYGHRNERKSITSTIRD